MYSPSLNPIPYLWCSENGPKQQWLVANDDPTFNYWVLDTATLACTPISSSTGALRFR